MGDKSIRTNESKKKKKSSDVKSIQLKEPLAEPELVQKKKKKSEEA